MESRKPPQPNAERRKRGLFIWIALVMVLLLALGIGLWWYLANKEAPERGFRDADAVQGRVQQLSEDEIREQMNEVVREGMFNVSIAANVVVFSVDQIAQWRIENKDINRYLMQVNVYLDELDGSGLPTENLGQLIYATQIIEPGYYIPTAKLQLPEGESLAEGIYDATAVFTALYMDDERVLGTTAVKIKLYVLDRPTPTQTPEPTPELTPEPTLDR